MIGDVYITEYCGLSFKLLAADVRAEEVINIICNWTPSLLSYEEIPLTDTLILYQIKVPKEKELINCYFLLKTWTQLSRKLDIMRNDYDRKYI